MLLSYDVVIPTKGEWCFPLSVKAARKVIDVNKVITVCPSSYVEKARQLCDVVVPCDKVNIGYARALALEKVETTVFISVDSDIIVNREWYEWCKKAIQSHSVAACQGYPENTSGIFPQIHIDYIRKGGLFGRGFCTFDNVFFKTELVREAGIPRTRVLEDWGLRLRLEALGYTWLSNLDLRVQHLRNDANMLHHDYWWVKVGAQISTMRMLVRVPYYLTFALRQRPFKHNLFLVAENLAMLLGKFAGAFHSSDAESKDTVLAVMEELWG